MITGADREVVTGANGRDIGVLVGSEEVLEKVVREGAIGHFLIHRGKETGNSESD